MKIGISNEFWGTAGGGENYAASIAEALVPVGKVELLCAEDTDWSVVSDRLQIDLHPFSKRVVDFTDAAQLEKAFADYDLLVNTSFATSRPSAARHSLLVVHFPFRPERRSFGPRALALRAAQKARLVNPKVTVEWISGFGPLERGTPTFRWTDGEAVIHLWLPPRVTKEVAMSFGRDRPEPGRVEVVYQGTTLAAVDIGPGLGGDLSFKVTGRTDGTPTPLMIRCPGFRPADHGISDDTRLLGAQLTGLRIGGERVHRLVGRLRPYDDADPMRWLDSYDRILVNSSFTQQWVRKWWDREADVLYPAIHARSRGPKAPIIISVGRFFPSERGHSKHQLEMVEAFRSLVEAGVTGWELHLVGGCQKKDLPYLERVRAAAAGLPVKIHVDLPGLLLADLYARASIYWHATGLSASRSNPESQEHFGIAVVEGMSAGAVPIVFGAAGPAETVQDGISGLHFRTVADLAAKTRSLIDDPARLQRLSQAAEARAGEFSADAMGRRLRAIVSDVIGN